MSDKIDSSGLIENMETADDSSPDKRSKNSKGSHKSKNPILVDGGDEDGQDEVDVPVNILHRVNALRKLQLESVNIESQFYQKVHELECEYAERMAPLYEKRRQIINGEYEPGENEYDIAVPLDREFLAEELYKQSAINNDLPESEKTFLIPDGKGLNEFWVTVLRNDATIGGMVETQDEAVLKHLTNIEVVNSKTPAKFTLVFHFSPNDYFTNTTLTKEYTMECKPDPKDPFSYSGPEIVSTVGCKIDWKPGKNLTVKTVTKKQKHKQKGGSRIVTKEEKTPTFFDFFSPPEIPKGQNDDADPEIREALEFDFQIGQMFRDNVVPRAVLHYTGEALDDDDEYEDEEDDEMDYDDSDDSVDDDADIPSKKK